MKLLAKVVDVDNPETGTVRLKQSHSSEWDDYCGVCGAPIGPMGALMPSATVVEAPKQSCPACREVREAGESFCEACGHDFGGSTLQPMSSSPRSHSRGRLRSSGGVARAAT